jgi:glycosyltransferase involved in cell wall biosynthesis
LLRLTLARGGFVVLLFGLREWRGLHAGLCSLREWSLRKSSHYSLPLRWPTKQARRSSPKLPEHAATARPIAKLPAMLYATPTDSPADSPPDSSTPAPLQLAVIIPTFNEIGNLEELLRRLHIVLAGIQWEAVFVDDDSPDGTAAQLRQIAGADSHVRCIRRVGRRGLSSACVEGMLSTHAPYLAVMDADLQHDEALLPKMLAEFTRSPPTQNVKIDSALSAQNAGYSPIELANPAPDLVIGSRYVPGGGVTDWDSSRLQISQFATRLSQRILGVQVSDPMSGFFMIRRSAFEACVYRLSSIGFKILVDLIVSSPKPLVIRELPFQFRSRHAGESKLDNRVAWDYLMLLADKSIGRYIPTRLLSFSIIGGSGVLVHLVARHLPWRKSARCWCRWSATSF